MSQSETGDWKVKDEDKIPDEQNVDNYRSWMISKWEPSRSFSLFLSMFENVHNKKFKEEKIMPS